MASLSVSEIHIPSIELLDLKQIVKLVKYHYSYTEKITY